MTDAEKKPCCCAAEPAEKDTAPSCCRHKDRTPEEYRALANRLSRIEDEDYFKRVTGGEGIA